MKKILFATTALVATAGVASADVTISGRAGFGVQHDGVANTSVLRNYFDLYFTGTTETDGGVALSATVEMEAIQGSPNFGKSGGVNATTIFSATAGALSFTYGNTDGAFDRSMTEAHRIAGIGYELWTGTSFIDNDDDENVARLEYNMGGVRASLSYAGRDKSTGVGLVYSGDLGGASITVGAAYETQEAVAAVVPFTNPVTGAVTPGYAAQAADDYWGISGRATFGAFSVGAGWADSKNKTVFDNTWNISAAYSANGVMVGANYMDADPANSKGYTVFGTYDLGGGAQAFAQYGERGNGTTKTGSMGIAFTF